MSAYKYYDDIDDEVYRPAGTTKPSLSIRDHVDGPVEFQYYKDGNLWYLTKTNFLFPVPIEDTGTAMFKNMDKGLFFMRWIRKHMEVIDKKDN